MPGEVLWPWWSFILLGLASGAISGMFGIGAGIVMVPALVLLVGLTQHSAQGMSLMIMVALALAGAIRYKLSAEVHVDVGITVMMAIGGVVGAIAGATLAVHLPGPILRKLFAAFIFVIAIYMFFSPGRTSSARENTVPAEAGSNAGLALEKQDTDRGPQ